MNEESFSKKKIILIGGAPCIGKSTVAENLSRRLKTNHLSTDTVRSLLRAASDKNKYHSLHFFMHKEASKYLPSTSVEQIIKDWIKESDSVWMGIRRTVKSNKYNNIGVIEGVANLPVLCKKSRLKNILPVFLYSDNSEIIRENLFSRGLWGDSKKLKEYEVKYLIEFNNYVAKTAKKYNYDLVNIYPYKTLQKRFYNIIKNKLTQK